MTVAEIIEAKGGPTAFAGKVRRTAGAVRVWKHRNEFPRDAWPEILQAFPDITLDRLLALEGRTASAKEVAA
jgi:hypothetical protein